MASNRCSIKRSFFCAKAFSKESTICENEGPLTKLLNELGASKFSAWMLFKMPKQSLICLLRYKSILRDIKRDQLVVSFYS